MAYYEELANACSQMADAHSEKAAEARRIVDGCHADLAFMYQALERNHIINANKWRATAIKYRIRARFYES